MKAMDKNEKETILYLLNIIVYGVLSAMFGYAVGMNKAFDKMMPMYESYKEMFDRHTQEQWMMIEHRDSLYCKTIDGYREAFSE